MPDATEPRLVELCRRVVTMADAGEPFPDDAAVQAVLDDPAAANFPITAKDDPGVACSDWTEPAGGWPKREWLIEGWLPVGRLGMLSGRGGRGKSRLVLQLAAKMASKRGAASTGTPPEKRPEAAPECDHVLQNGASVEGKPGKGGHRHPFRLEPDHCGPVVFASWEDEPVEVGRRLAAMAQDDLVDVGGLEDRLLYLDLRGKGPVWAPAHEKHLLTEASLTKIGQRVRATAESIGARLLVLDSLAGAYASDENVRPLVRAFCASWDAWGTEHRCAVLLIAHPPKRPAGKSGSTIDEDTDDDFAGSTDWHNAVRFRWSLGNADTGCHRVQKNAKSSMGGQQVAALALACQKSSYGEKPDQTLFLAPADKGRIGWKAISGLRAAKRAIAQHRGWKLKNDTNQETGHAEEADWKPVRD